MCFQFFQIFLSWKTHVTLQPTISYLGFLLSWVLFTSKLPIQSDFEVRKVCMKFLKKFRFEHNIKGDDYKSRLQFIFSHSQAGRCIINFLNILERCILLNENIEGKRPEKLSLLFQTSVYIFKSKPQLSVCYSLTVLPSKFH